MAGCNNYEGRITLKDIINCLLMSDVRLFQKKDHFFYEGSGSFSIPKYLLNCVVLGIKPTPITVEHQNLGQYEWHEKITQPNSVDINIIRDFDCVKLREVLDLFPEIENFECVAQADHAFAKTDEWRNIMYDMSAEDIPTNSYYEDATFELKRDQDFEPVTLENGEIITLDSEVTAGMYYPDEKYSFPRVRVIYFCEKPWPYDNIKRKYDKYFNPETEPHIPDEFY